FDSKFYLMRFQVSITIALLLLTFYSNAQICFQDNAINYSQQTGHNNMNDVASGLFNNDNFPDLAFLYQNKIQFRYGTGTGLFTNGTQITLASYITHLETADLDNDGNIDLIALEGSYHFHFLYGDGNGNFADSVHNAPVFLQQQGKLFIDDINGDGYKDAIYAASSDTFYVTVSSSSIFQYNVTTHNVPFTIGTSTLGSFDNDSYSDLVFTNSTGPGTYIPYYGDGTAFTAGTPVPLVFSIVSLGIADMNHDGFTDIIYATSTTIQIAICNSGGIITSTTVLSTDIGNSFHFVNPNDLLIYDTNNDNYPEVIIPSEYNYEVFVVN